MPRQLRKIWLFCTALIGLVGSAAAHCPLCTAGAAAAAAGAAYLGVDVTAVSLFIGAFAVSTGWWMARKIPRQFIPYQTAVVVIASFLLTVVPLSPLLSQPSPFYLSLMGGYGTLLNRTYVYDMALLTALLGGTIVALSPHISRSVTALRDGQHLPFQGILLTFGILLFTGGALQVI